MSRDRVTQLLPCPFCGRVMPPDEGDNLIDILYPSGTYWRMKGRWKHYVSHPERQEGDQQCWGVHCAGCSAEVSGDSMGEAVAAWNRRATDVVPQRVAGAQEGGNSDGAQSHSGGRE